MFAKDFVFNGQKASDYDLVICSFNGDMDTASGGEMEYNVVKPPDSDIYEFYGGQYNTVLEWTFSIMKNPCKYENDDEMFFSKYEERQLFKWLQKKDDYHWFAFLEEENEEDILYKVTINMAPHQIGGKTIGYDLTVTANSAFGFSPLIVKKAVINNQSSLLLYVDTDSQNYILPVINISGKGEISIKNESDPGRKSQPAKFNLDKNIETEIQMNSEFGIITGISSSEKFNWNFLRLVDGKNVITTTSTDDVTIEFKYREIRRAIV